MITTIKIKKRVKDNLDKHKMESESYSDVIEKILSTAEKTKMKEKLIEGYSNQDKKEFEEWESANL